MGTIQISALFGPDWERGSGGVVVKTFSRFCLRHPIVVAANVVVHPK